MSSIVIAGDTSGSVTLQAPAVSGSTVLNLPTTSGTLQTSGAGYTTNGVAYASSTSALTTGNALTFDGTNLASTGNITSGGVLQALTTVQSSSGADLSLNANGANRDVIYKVNATELMRLVGSTGNLGLGTSSPAYKLNIVDAKTLTPTTGDGQIAIDNSTASQVSAILFSSQGTRRAQISAGLGGTGNDGYLAFTTRSDSTGFGERARIDSSGNFLVGTTSAFDSAYTMSLKVRNATGGLIIQPGSDNYTAITFNNAAGVGKGSISVSSTATTYNTSSDYRLKNTIAPMTGALAKVALLKPCTYKWNADGSDGEGFIAHELAEVCPHAVTGEKDAVDADGNPKYQGIDTSFLVATLTAAIQEQQTLINTLTDRVSLLENK